MKQAAVEIVALCGQDPMLWCVSSWNDHGQAHLVADARALGRSDFFPGLGWMLGRDTWDSLRPRWCVQSPTPRCRTDLSPVPLLRSFDDLSQQ